MSNKSEKVSFSTNGNRGNTQALTDTTSISQSHVNTEPTLSLPVEHERDRSVSHSGSHESLTTSKPMNFDGRCGNLFENITEENSVLVSGTRIVPVEGTS